MNKQGLIAAAVWIAAGTLSAPSAAPAAVQTVLTTMGKKLAAAVKSGAGHAFLWTPSTSGGTTGSMQGPGYVRRPI